VRAPSRQALLEREGELSRCDALLASAQAGDGRALLIRGPAGIGKSRLLAELRSRADAAGTTTLSARGAELEQEFPFGVARQLLESAIIRAGEGEGERLLSDTAGLAAGAGRRLALALWPRASSSAIHCRAAA
jgi:predicted ATPase